MATDVYFEQPQKNVVVATWAALVEDEDGNSIDIADHTIKTVQVTGTFANETVTIQGSNDGSNWATLHDLQDNDLAFTADGLEAIQECPLYIRPSVGTGGGAGTVDVKVVIVGTGFG